MSALRLLSGLILLILALSWQSAGGFSPARQEVRTDQYERLKEQAEALFAEGSYRRALDVCEQAARLDLRPDEQRWVNFRIGDVMWRSQAATQTHDNTTYEKARQKLQAVIDDYRVETDRDLTWALAHESLGDFWWMREHSQNWHQGWQHYRMALEYWAGSRDIESARRNYLNLIFRAAQPPWTNHWHRRYGHVNVPADVLENAVKIANSSDDRFHAQYLLAMAMRGSGGIRQQQRVAELFKSVIEGNRRSEWYDDALFHCAEWLTQRGRIIRLENGSWTSQPDFEKALELFRRLVREFGKGETQFLDDARQRINEITSPSLGLAVSNIFMPDSEIQFSLNWRNVEAIDLAIYAVDLTTDINIPKTGTEASSWLSRIDLSKAQRARTWTRETTATRPYFPDNATVVLEERLAPGAYVIEAVAAGRKARDLLLVTDSTIVLKSVADRALTYFADAIDGSPIAGADVLLWESRYDGNRWQSWRHEAITDDDGLALFQLHDEVGHGNLFIAARAGARQALVTGNANQQPGIASEYRIYASTDRPAYRPGDTVQWKMTARIYRDSKYTTPSNQSLHYEINDPRGTKVKEGDLALNEFGSAWGDFKLGETFPLGAYTITFRLEKNGSWIGQAPLFRMEEYKLPEFEVSVTTPKEDGKAKIYQVGDVIEAEIHAEYYFGAPVANADVEVIVYQSPFWQYWAPQKDYPWLYSNQPAQNWRHWYGNGQQIKREQLKTDESGRATISFETPFNANQDFEYRVEARVVDSSRREVVGSDVVRVTRQKYFVYANPEHNIYQPKENVAVSFKAIDANQQPVETTGRVEVFRDEWTEIWIAPDGREITGEELARERARHRTFPPAPGPREIGWRLKHRGYTSEEILSREITTNEQGEAEFDFTPQVEGYYRIAWLSEKYDMYPVRAQTAVWVCDDASRDIGYFHGGVDVIVDRDTFKAGQTAPVMITVPTNNRYVLFTVEGNRLHDYRLVHLEGSVKLFHVEVKEEHEPNVWLNASMVSEGRMFGDVEEVVVPPVQHFLDIEVSMDRDAYEPGESGSISIIATDHEGKPVSAEIGLAMIDESIYYIQEDLAGDPRQFFFSDRQWQQVQTVSTMNHRQYVRLKKMEDERIVPAAIGRENDGNVDRADSFADDELLEHRARRESQDADVAGAAFGRGGARAPSASAESLRDVVEEAGVASAKARGRMGESNLAGPDPNVRVRTDFRATALWLPDLITDASGRATAEIIFPDSTTRWKATARAATTGSGFGIGSATARTRQPLIVRLQAPRFFVVGDYTVVSAVINNNTDKPLTALYGIEIDGLEVTDVEIDGRRIEPNMEPLVEVPANGSRKVDWRVAVREAGTAHVLISAKAGPHTDGMTKTYPVYEHGIEKHLIRTGKVRGDDITVQLDIPGERRDGSTNLVVQVTPSMAVTMLDALPYLIDYPYGCTEQTMSRFLPTAIVARTIGDLGIDPEIAMSRVFGGIEPEFADKTHPRGAKNLDQLNDMVARGLARLQDFQRSDGGWGWWKDSPQSDRYMSAYVVWGLSLAKKAGIGVDDAVLARGAEYLRKELVEEEFNHDMQAWMLHALAAYQHSLGDNARSEFEVKAIERLWAGRDKLNAFTRALFALAVHYYGDAEKAQILIRNLENGVKVDQSPDTSVIVRGNAKSHPAVIPTAHWGEDGMYYRWSDGGIEATAFALRALLTIQPDHELIEPVTNWLIRNRRGAQWSNTRDTAIVILALTDYLRASGELKPDLQFELLVNGTSVAKKNVTPDDLFAAPSRFEIDPRLIHHGRNNIRIVRSRGAGPIYFSIDAEFFSEEEPIEPAGHEIFVRRDYYKLVPAPTLLNGYEYDRVPMKDGDHVRSGERIEVVLTIETKNNYEYLVFEDLKPAGVEAVAVQSGGNVYAREIRKAGIERRFVRAGPIDAGDIARDGSDYTGRNAWLYQELRDRHVAIFFDRLPEGVWELQYELRAEVPGEFHALPVLGHAMYVPEIRCNSREMRMTVYDRE